MEKVIITITIIVIATAFSMIGYAIYEDIDYGTKQGVVVDKKYVKAYTYTTYTTTIVGKSLIQVPYQGYVPEKYKIKIEKVDNYKTKSIWIEVIAEEYNNLNIGDSYGGYLEE